LLLVCFFRAGLWLTLPRVASDQDPATFTFRVGGITDVYQPNKKNFGGTELDLRVSQLLGMHSTHSTPVVTPSAHFPLFMFWIGFCVFAWGQPQTTILLPICLPRAGMTGSHHHTWLVG
jgi:hypothetical protein